MYFIRQKIIALGVPLPKHISGLSSLIVNPQHYFTICGIELSKFCGWVKGTQILTVFLATSGQSSLQINLMFSVRRHFKFPFGVQVEHCRFKFRDCVM